MGEGAHPMKAGMLNMAFFRLTQLKSPSSVLTTSPDSFMTSTLTVWLGPTTLVTTRSTEASSMG